MFKVGVIICLFGLLINNAQSFELSKLNRTKNICPNQANPGLQVADKTVSKGYLETVRVRVPETGLLGETISCILITDLRDGHNDPVVVQGGLGSNYVEIEAKPFLLEKLSYRVQVYTEYPTTTSEASTGGSTTPK